MGLYSYDGAGNRTQQIRAGSTGAAAGTISYSYNAANELTATSADTSTWSYDANGDQTKSGATGQTQAINDRLTVTALGSSTYSAFGQGNAIPLAQTSPTISFTLAPAGLASQTMSTGITAFTRSATGDLISERNGTTSNYYVKDSLGSVVGLFDSTGAWQGGYSYSPYGETRAAGTSATVTTNALRYIGGYLDASSGLYHLGARYYDASDGRFTQLDPSGHEANPYAYASNDPVNKEDPSGRDAISAVIKLYKAYSEASSVLDFLEDLGNSDALKKDLLTLVTAGFVAEVCETAGIFTAELATPLCLLLGDAAGQLAETLAG